MVIMKKSQERLIVMFILMAKNLQGLKELLSCPVGKRLAWKVQKSKEKGMSRMFL